MEGSEFWFRWKGRKTAVNTFGRATILGVGPVAKTRRHKPIPVLHLHNPMPIPFMTVRNNQHVSPRTGRHTRLLLQQGGGGGTGRSLIQRLLGVSVLLQRADLLLSWLLQAAPAPSGARILCVSSLHWSTGRSCTKKILHCYLVDVDTMRLQERLLVQNLG